MEVAADDPLRPSKLALLSALGAGQGAAPRLARLPLDACLAAARALVMRTDEWEAWAPGAAALRDLASCISPRNEAAALALLHAHAGGVCGGDAARARRLAELSEGYCARTGAPGPAAALAAGASPPCDSSGAGAGGGGEPASAAAGCSPAGALQAWAEARGMDTALAPAVFSGGLRGLAAPPGRGALPAGAHVLSLPAALLITYQTARESDLGRALARIPGLDDEAVAVIWTMVERHDPDADAAPFWAALPQRFCTGLSAPSALVDLLAGTPCHQTFSEARTHLRRQHAALGPVFRSLLAAYGQHLRAEWFEWGAFAWAAELWYAYAIQVRFPDGVTRPALAPFANLLNHSPWPHVVRFSQVDAASGCLRLQLLRPAAEGEEVCLSYGPLPNEELLLFYGFVVRGNPFERQAVCYSEAEAAEAVEAPENTADPAAVATAAAAPPKSGGSGGQGDANAAAELRRRRLAALERWGLRPEAILWPSWRGRQMQRLLPAARVMAAGPAELPAADAAAAPAKGAGRGRAGRGGKGGRQRPPQARQLGVAEDGWPWKASSAENEAAAVAVLEAAAARTRGPYAAALRRVRAELQRAAQAATAGDAHAGSCASGGCSSSSGGGFAAAAAGGGGEGGGSSDEEGHFSAEERRAFLLHLEVLLSGADELLAPPHG